MNKISKIILHCSDSNFGTAILIDGWHRARGWSKIGYAGVILNGWVKSDFYNSESDGSWEWGRTVDNDEWLEPDEVGAHALGLNSTTIGICLIGKNKFSDAQFLEAKSKINFYLRTWNLTFKDVLGHYEVDKAGKTCPNIDMDMFRKFLDNEVEVSELHAK